jgi:PAP2 superfamily
MLTSWTPAERLRFQIIAGLLVLDAILLAAGPMRLDFSSLLMPVTASGALLGLALWYRARQEATLSTIITGTAQLIAFTAAGAMLNYLLVPYTGPLMDPFFYGVDQAFGIHWPSLFAAVKSHSWLSVVLTTAYLSTLIQVALAVPLLGLLGRAPQLDHFLLALMLSLVMTIAIWVAMPSFGAGPHLYATGQMTSFPGAVLGDEYARLMLALKAGQIREFSLADAEGLIGFPSYHTVMAALTVYAVRGVRRLFWPVVVWNALVIAAVPVDGAHNVCDAVGGLAVAWASIAVSHRWLARVGAAATLRADGAAPASAPSSA